MLNTVIPGLTTGTLAKLPLADGAAWDLEAEGYAVAREAEILAMTEALKFQDAIPQVQAISLAGIVSKLEMIVGADRDIGDPTDFPWPHIASALRDLKAITGELPTHRLDREATRADVAKHWEAAVQLIAALNEEDTFEHREQPA